MDVFLIAYFGYGHLRVIQDYLGVQHELTLLEFSATVLSTEIDTISDALGGPSQYCMTFSLP